MDLIIYALFSVFQSTNQSDHTEVIGNWKWEYTSEIGMKPSTNAFYNIRISGNSLKATFEGGPVDSSRRTMKKVSYQNGKIRIDHLRPNMYYLGQISEDQTKFLGEIIHHGHKDKLNLIKVDKQ